MKTKNKSFIADAVVTLPPSGIRAFFDLVLGMKDVISFGVGEPDFVTPWHICESAIDSIEHGFTSYTSNKGLFRLRELISADIKKAHGQTYDPENEILITVGVSQGMDLAMRAILNPGDEVIIPQPCYVAYGPDVILAGGVPRYLQTKGVDRFKVTPQALDRLCNKKTKAVILNYPANPTGTSYTKKELGALADVIKKNRILVISDEIYGHLTYDFAHTSLCSLPGMREWTLYMNGVSKAYAMTGWRIGYAAGPQDIIGGMTKIHQYTMLCAPITGQIAACEALQNSWSDVERMKQEYNRRRRYIVDGLNKIGLPCHMPDGAFYAFCSIKDTSLDCLTFASTLLKEERVAVVPGSAFGESGSDFIRLSYATSLDNIKEGLRRIGAFVQRHKK